MSSDRVRVRVPGEATLFIGPSGDMVMIEEGRWANLLADDVRLVLFSGLPDSLHWREINAELIQTLKRPTATPAVSVADLQHAADMARPIDPFNKAAIARQTLAAWRSGR
jgi:hypothetical protein